VCVCGDRTQDCCIGSETLPHMCRGQSVVIGCMATRHMLARYGPMSIQEGVSSARAVVNSSSQVTIPEWSVRGAVCTSGKMDHDSTFVGPVRCACLILCERSLRAAVRAHARATPSYVVRDAGHCVCGHLVVIPLQ